MLKNDESHKIVVQEEVKKSLFGMSALHKFSSTPIDFKDAVEIFSKESSRALLFSRNQTELLSVFRREQYKTFILKTLIHIGVSANGSGIAVLARLIEILTLEPAMSPDQAIQQFALSHAASFGTVERIVEKHFNVYNEQFFSRVTRVTQSQPMTPKDVLCDLSVFVRMNFMQEIKI